MNLTYVIRELYARQIDCTMQTQWDAGVVVSIDDVTYHERQASETFTIDKLDRAAQWLDTKARELYPEAFAADKAQAA